MKKLLKYLIYLYTLLIFTISFLPSSELEEIPFRLLWDKLMHTVEYFIWGVFAFIFVDGVDSRDRAFGVVLVAAFVGAIDEGIQSTSAGRCVDIWDWCVDVFGAFLGITISYLFAKPFLRPD
ncbi:MAG TPA: hypothetical protein ENI43_02150 [Firmicutes bacterium]|nr:hypothetical protein [Bacillota bacterium]